MNSFSQLLFARPSFFEGAGRVLDWGDSLTAFNQSPSSDEADRIATASDWHAVGADLAVAISQYRTLLADTQKVANGEGS